MRIIRSTNPSHIAAGQGTFLGCNTNCVLLWLQVASVMGLMAVALDLLLLIHPMSNAQDELKEMSSSRQDLKHDMEELTAAGFLKPCKETPDSWDFAQVSLPFPSPHLIQRQSNRNPYLGVLNVLSSCSVSACTQHVHAAAAVSVQHYRSYVGWESVMGRYWEAEALQQ